MFQQEETERTEGASQLPRRISLTDAGGFRSESPACQLLRYLPFRRGEMEEVLTGGNRENGGCEPAAQAHLHD